MTPLHVALGLLASLVLVAILVRVLGDD